MVAAAGGMGRGHRHDEARGAEAALRAVMVDQRLLHRMEAAVGRGEALDSPDLLALKLGQEQEAGVQRAGPGLVGHHHRAGAAVALVAALLGAGEPAVLAQEVEQRPGGLRRDAEGRSVQDERDLRHVKTCRLLWVRLRRCRPPDAA